MRTQTKLAILLVVITTLQACSAVRIGYGNAESLARWWLDHYLDFSPEQNQFVVERLARLHAWHRKTELRGYAVILGEARTLLDRTPTPADAMQLGDAMTRRVRVVAQQALPDMAELLVSLSPAQLDHLKRRFAEKNREYAKDAGLEGGEAAQHEARAKRLLSRAEYWLGRLTEDQRSEFRRLVAQRTSGAQYWYDERLRRQRGLLDLAQRIRNDKLDREAALALLQEYAAQFESPGDPVRKAVGNALRQDTASLVVSLHAMMTPAQRKHARERIDDLLRDIADLADDA